jgi:hypothetical protein
MKRGAFNRRRLAVLSALAPCVLLLMLTACVTEPLPRPAAMDTLPAMTTTLTPAASDITRAPGLPATLAAGKPVSTALPTQYDLSVGFDYARHRLDVSETVRYVNHTAIPLDDLLFVVESNRQRGVFRFQRATWADGSPVDDVSLAAASMKIPVKPALMPGAALTLTLFFELDVPDRSGPFGYSKRQVNLGDWYPFIPPYQAGAGWLAHEPAEVGEHLVYDAADYRVEIRVVDAPDDLVIAASAPVERDGDRYRYRLEAARSFAWSASTDYRVISQTTGSGLVAGYVFPEHLAAGRAAVQATAEALVLYSQLFAPYPHHQLSVVEADFPDGMEYEGLYFLGEEYYAGYNSGPRNYLTTIAVHETAHQWWYGLVGNDQALEPWLDEALATYSELLFYENEYPDLIDWWWQFRVKRFNPAGRVNSTIYDHTGFRSYVNAVYLRGALFLEEVRQQVRDEAFFEFLREYVAGNVHGVADKDGFFTLLLRRGRVNLIERLAAYFRE